MPDKLKDFIKSNDADFDTLPNAGHFDRFKQKQNEFIAQNVEKVRWYAHPVFKMVAMFVVVFAVGWLFYNLGKQQSVSSIASASPEGLATEHTELLAAEVFFANELKEKKTELLSLASVNEPETQKMLMELEKLELQYIDLKEELAVNSNNQRIVSAMVQNYRTRLEVLERLLAQLKKSQSLKMKHHVQIQA